MTTADVIAPRSSGLLKRFFGASLTARILFPVAVIVVWYLVWFTLESRIFVAPHKVFAFMWDEVTLNTPLKYGSVKSNLYGMFGITIFRLLTGFAVSMVVGTAVGLAMGLSKRVNAFFHDWVMAILAMPALVWGLFLGLVFGFGHQAPIYACILAGIPFVIVNVREGVKNTPKELFDMARAFGVPQQRVTRNVLLPSLMPFFFAAVRYAFSVGWKGLVIAEVFGSDRGMGWTIKFWYDAHRTQGVIGYGLFFVIFALVLERLIFEPLSRRAFKWRPQAGGIDVVEETFLLDETIEGAGEAEYEGTGATFTKDKGGN
jgi:ABC-type nitrate/sulfonate/bicarbonate transport system permease component